MSRIGKSPIKINDSVKIDIKSGGQFAGQIISVTGPKGTLEVELRPDVNATFKDGEIIFELTSSKSNYYGLYRTLVNNAVVGVTDGYSKELEIVGIGYKAENKGRDLSLNIGLNHPVIFSVPEGINVTVKDNVFVTITGIDKQLVGETAASIRRLKKPEPYKGKGIKYVGEIIKRKAGKAA